MTVQLEHPNGADHLMNGYRTTLAYWWLKCPSRGGRFLSVIYFPVGLYGVAPSPCVPYSFLKGSPWAALWKLYENRSNALMNWLLRVCSAAFNTLLSAGGAIASQLHAEATERGVPSAQLLPNDGQLPEVCLSCSIALSSWGLFLLLPQPTPASSSLSCVRYKLQQQTSPFTDYHPHRPPTNIPPHRDAIPALNTDMKVQLTSNYRHLSLLFCFIPLGAWWGLCVGCYNDFYDRGVYMYECLSVWLVLAQSPCAIYIGSLF